MNEEFDKLKAEYSNQKTTDDRKKQLVDMMRENLKERVGENRTSFVDCMGKEYLISSQNVSDLYAIDFMLKDERRKSVFDKIAEDCRNKANDKNNYSTNNPYS